MAFFRQYIAPVLVALTFLVALLAVSARIFLPADMAQPAPIEAAPERGDNPPGAAAQALTAPTAPALAQLSASPWLKALTAPALNAL